MEMKFSIGDSVIILLPTNLTTPGMSGTIRQYRQETCITEYNVYIPAKQKTRWFAEKDLIGQFDWITQSAKNVMKYHLLNFALDNMDKQMFDDLCSDSYVMVR